MDYDFRQRSQQTSSSMLGEVWAFLKHTRKWWLVPILALLALFAALLLAGGTGAAPFIYTLF